MKMLKRRSLAGGAIALGGLMAASAQANLIHRYSFTTNANDSVGSANGTLVNDKRIGAATKLRKGDRVQVGETVLEAQR